MDMLGSNPIIRDICQTLYMKDLCQTLYMKDLCQKSFKIIYKYLVLKKNLGFTPWLTLLNYSFVYSP